MSNVVSLAEYRERRALVEPECHLKLQGGSNPDILLENLWELRHIVFRLDSEIAGLRDSVDAAVAAFNGPAMRLELERSQQPRADTKTIVQLIDAGDVGGCIVLRDAILARTECPVEG